MEYVYICMSNNYPFFIQYDHRRVDKHETLDKNSLDSVPNSPNDALVNSVKKLPGTPNVAGFNETAYILGSKKITGDAYKWNAFNQAASDGLANNRPIPDTRHYL